MRAGWARGEGHGGPGHSRGHSRATPSCTRKLPRGRCLPSSDRSSNGKRGADFQQGMPLERLPGAPRTGAGLFLGAAGCRSPGAGKGNACGWDVLLPQGIRESRGLRNLRALRARKGARVSSPGHPLPRQPRGTAASRPAPSFPREMRHLSHGVLHLLGDGPSPCAGAGSHLWGCGTQQGCSWGAWGPGAGRCPL